ncbi:N-lysine methyltransferase KMT5A-A-like [Xyrauchen texanus]|nr:N-lysine methyltransferase KMT5A-A-like [Xyrauchen texanus]XP_052009215.1 N-lysine methyltransferase KMT5A-A-like [Xyrauchen texanus]
MLAIRKRRRRPQQDAEDNIIFETEKPGLQEQYISKYKGRGVFTTESFCRGDFVLEYRGELLSSKESLERTKNYTETESTFLFDFQWHGKYWCMDASKEDKSLGRLVNDEHKNPTCKMRTVEVKKKPHLCLFAVRDILPGEEITYNYGDSDWPWRAKSLNEPSTESSDVKSVSSLGPQKSVSTVNSASLLVMTKWVILKLRGRILQCIKTI